ncbi:hypothetical protein CSOJ01_09290 [Colletotrichum sojae]|uniref:Uncharacterized protein n=1 Tax=Colletotrichum sojae TaxID=2175907 RepID=A0A8H6J3E5_9PEZI|nr:hypothetical protein CSOJ01_09290 [Colletotrichum sojae]
MSGFEVAGLALGSIPVIVSALKVYPDGISNMRRWRSYERELRNLGIKLGVEHLELQTLLQNLLVGALPHSRIENMIKDPFGPDWKKDEFHDVLRLRLWRSPELFESVIVDIKLAMDQIQSKLKLDHNGKASPSLSREQTDLLTPPRSNGLMSRHLK